VAEIAVDVQRVRGGGIGGDAGALAHAAVAALATAAGMAVAYMAGPDLARDVGPAASLAALPVGLAAAGALLGYPGDTAADRAERRMRVLTGALLCGLTHLMLARIDSDHPLAVVWIPVVVVAVCAALVPSASTGRRSRRSRPAGTFALRPTLPAPPLPPLCRLVKRTTDVVGATLLLLLCAPVLAVAAAAIALESPGGCLFRQTRLGRNARPFTLYKLRTMHVANDDGDHLAYVVSLVGGGAERRGDVYKLADDPRRTRLGAVLRRLSIDELPQLFNVLRGDMSLVGPRPTAVTEALLWDLPTWQRLAVKPGLTGLWQVSGRSRLGFDEMIALDIEYGRRWTPLLDLRILLRTPRAVLAGDTA
jgi:lipopolysaccharide/colanic/teichoic acid biosynthesis glycosyltransferase